MPYLVEPAVLPPVTTLPNGAISPQLQQFIGLLAQHLNGLEQRGLHLEQVLQVQNVALLIYRQ